MNRDQRDSKPLLKAVRAMGRAYDFTAIELSRITGIEAVDLESAGDEERTKTLNADQTQAAQEILRLHKELSAIFGQDARTASGWLHTKNLDFDARPVDIIRTTEGIEKVCDYLRDYQSRS